VAGSGQGVQPFRTVQDYDNFLSRMDGFVAWVDHSIANMQLGVTKGIVQPKIVVERTIRSWRPSWSTTQSRACSGGRSEFSGGLSVAIASG